MDVPSQQRIAWSKAEQRFVPLAHSTASTLFTSSSQSTLLRDLTVAKSGDLEGEVIKFSVRSYQNINELSAIRALVQARIVGDGADHGATESPEIALLPAFVSSWGRHLRSIEARTTEENATAIISEATAYALTSMLMGEMIPAREALGRGVQLARRYDLPTLHQITDSTKRILIDCARFQHTYKRCRAALERIHASPLVLRAVLVEIESLSRVAPYSVAVTVLKVTVLQRQQRFKQVMETLAAFPSTDSSAQLSLAYVRSLECEGFYQDSIVTACAFVASDSEKEDAATIALAKHSDHLRQVLAKKNEGDDALVTSQFQTAATAFSDALGVLRSDSHSLRAALLFGRANGFIGLDRLLSARSDLHASLALDPTNQLARMRLRTVALTLETHAFYRRTQS